MFVVIHTKTMPETGHWCWPESFRYWWDRRSVLKKRGDLISEDERLMGEKKDKYVRVELWRSKEVYDTFCDDIAARVIESVVKHDESLRGVIHETLFAVPES